MGLDDGVRLDIYYEGFWYEFYVRPGCSGCVEFRFENPQNGFKLGDEEFYQVHLANTCCIDAVSTFLLGVLATLEED